MKFTARIPVSVTLLAVLLGSTTGCDKLKSRDQINKGVAAFKNAQYEQAVNNFQTAVKLDPDSDNAKLYLATAYAYQVVPNLETPENLKLAQLALDGFNQVLAKTPNDPTALKQIASIDRNIKKFDKAKEDEKKVIAVAPNEAEAYYTIGFVDWTLAYRNAVAGLAADGIAQDDGNGNAKLSKGACEKLKEQNAPVVDEGIQYLTKAVEIDPLYDDAMTYMQLTYRRKADLECGDDAARKADMAKADEWVKKAFGARQEKERKLEEKNKGGVQM